MPYMYILRCTDGALITGFAWNLSHRLDEHEPESGAATTNTAWRRPVRLVYVEEFDRIDAAFYREREVHSWKRSRKERLIADGDGWNPLENF